MDIQKELIGKTFVKINGCNIGNDEIIFECSDGSKYIMHHIQDCCECVNIEDVTGDPEDLIGSPICLAEEVSNATNEAPTWFAESYSWTFYKFATIKGSVTLRWLGTSNGYYSEGVDFERMGQ